MRETVNINGTYYDAKTGLPVEPDKPKLDSPAPKASKPKKISVRAPKKITVSAASAAKPARPAKPAKAVRRPAPSSTLNRRFVAKPAQKPARPAPPKPITTANLRPTVSARPSPVAPRGVRRPSPPPAPSEPAQPEPTEQAKPSTKLISLITSGAIVLLAGLAVLAYFFIPAVSFWVASSAAEVRASMPTYAVAGYSVSGQAESSPGIVTLNYKSFNNNYSISMANSSWDSDGVLENKVKPATPNYQTLNQKGLTIFVIKDKALWVNGGILYTLEFSSELSNSEILKIVDGI
jgi:hypothetical protein